MFNFVLSNIIPSYILKTAITKIFRSHPSTNPKHFDLRIFPKLSQLANLSKMDAANVVAEFPENYDPTLRAG